MVSPACLFLRQFWTSAAATRVELSSKSEPLVETGRKKNSFGLRQNIEWGRVAIRGDLARPRLLFDEPHWGLVTWSFSRLPRSFILQFNPEIPIK
jgi:hypothetical protein